MRSELRRLLLLAGAAFAAGGATAAATIWWLRRRFADPRVARTIVMAEASYGFVPDTEQPFGAEQRDNTSAAAKNGVQHRDLLWASAVALILVSAVVGAWAYHQKQIGHRIDSALGGAGERAVPVMRANGCSGCHTISGVPGADGQVGPALDATLSSRRYIAGILPNNKENMIRWLRASRDIDPQSAMPSTGISEQEARDVAAYLYSLR